MKSIYPIFTVILMVARSSLSGSEVNKSYSANLIEVPIGDLIEHIESTMGVRIESVVNEKTPISTVFSNLSYSEAMSAISNSLQKSNVDLIYKSNKYYLATNISPLHIGAQQQDLSVGVVCEYINDTYYQALDQDIISGMPAWDLSQYPSDYIDAYGEAKSEVFHLDPNAIWVMKEMSLVRIGNSDKWYYKFVFDNVRMNRGEKRAMTIIIIRGNLRPAKRTVFPNGQAISPL